MLRPTVEPISSPFIQIANWWRLRGWCDDVERNGGGNGKWLFCTERARPRIRNSQTFKRFLSFLNIPSCSGFRKKNNHRYIRNGVVNKHGRLPKFHPFNFPQAHLNSLRHPISSSLFPSIRCFEEGYLGKDWFRHLQSHPEHQAHFKMVPILWWHARNQTSKANQSTS